MGLIFKPNGFLDVATDPSDLPSQSPAPGTVISEALTRCKNLRIDRKGVLTTRDGSSKINSTAFTSNSELVTNGSFTSDISSWTDVSLSGGAVSWSAGEMLLDSTSNIAIVRQVITFVNINKEHTLSFHVRTPTNFIGASQNANLSISIGTTPNGSDLFGPMFFRATSDGFTYTSSFTPTSTSAYLTITKAIFSVNIYLDDVSIKQTIDTINLIVEQGGARYEFAGSQIFRNETSIQSGTTDAQWSAIKYNAFNDTTQQVFAINGTDRKRISGSSVYEWGIDAPSDAPTVAATGTGLTGSYKVKYTYCRKVGSVVVAESNPSPESASQSLTNQSLRVTWIASTDSQVTHVRIYRTFNGGLIYYHDQDLAIGAVTLDTNTADGALGSEVATDHDRPPLGTVVVGPAFDGSVFMIKDNNLYSCKPKQPEYWPTDYYIEASTLQFPGKAGLFHNGQLFYLTKNDIFLMQGSSILNMIPIKQNAKTGAQGIFGAVSVKGKGIIHTGMDGLYLYSNADQKLTQGNFEPLFRGETVKGIPGVSDMSTSWLHVFGNYLYFGYTSVGYDYPTNILIFNLDTLRISYYEYNDGSVISIRCVATDETNTRLLAGDTVGFVRVLENKSVSTDSSTDIDWEVESMDYTLQTRRHFPRWAKYDVNASDAESCQAEIIVDGDSVQTHDITGDRETRFRHITTCNGKRCSLKISGTGPASIYAAELE